MDPQIGAAIINTVGTIVATVLVAHLARDGISREIRYRQRVDERRELFIVAVRDCANFIGDARTILNELHVLDENAALRRHEIAWTQRVEEIWRLHSANGALIPPDLKDQKRELDDRLLMARFSSIDAASAGPKDIPMSNAINDAYDALDAFIAAFEDWKAKHWREAVPKE